MRTPYRPRRAVPQPRNTVAKEGFPMLRFAPVLALLSLLLVASACTDQPPTEPTAADAPLLSTTADETLGLYDGSEPTPGGSHEVIVTVTNETVCRLTTFEGGGNLQAIHPLSNNTIPGSNADFPEWKTLTSGSFANNPSGVTIAVMLGTSHDVSFEFPVATVSFFYASAPSVRLDAVDAAGTLVATVTGAGNAQLANPRLFLWELIGVAVEQNVITRVTITGAPGGTAIDDFENCELTTPERLISLLIGDVQGLVESGVNASGLLAMLNQALTAIAADRPSAGNLLNAFIHQVEGFIAGGILTLAEGQALIDTAQFAIDQLSG